MDNNNVEYQKIVHPDGSYDEVIADNATGFVEIREYDAKGEFLSSTIGRFQDQEETPGVDS